jgi:hypothetical protein
MCTHLYQRCDSDDICEQENTRSAGARLLRAVGCKCLVQRPAEVEDSWSSLTVGAR